MLHVFFKRSIEKKYGNDFAQVCRAADGSYPVAIVPVGPLLSEEQAVNLAHRIAVDPNIAGRETGAIDLRGKPEFAGGASMDDDGDVVPCPMIGTLKIDGGWGVLSR